MQSQQTHQYPIIPKIVDPSTRCPNDNSLSNEDEDYHNMSKNCSSPSQSFSETAKTSSLDNNKKKIEKPIAIKPAFRPVSKNNDRGGFSSPPSMQKIDEAPIPNYSPSQNPPIFEPRSCEILDQQLRQEFPQLPHHVAMLLMQYKLAIENSAKQAQQQQHPVGLMENAIMQQYYYAQTFQQQQQQSSQQQSSSFLAQAQAQYPQHMGMNMSMNSYAHLPSQNSYGGAVQQQNNNNSLSGSNNQENVSISRKILKKKIQKSDKVSMHNVDRSKEQQKKEREETKNILRNTGNAIKNFHKEPECRELILKELDNDQELFKKYYSNFLPQKLEKFEDFQEIWHVDNDIDEMFSLKNAFRKICWTFMESYFFQYFFHKSRCQRESLRALVKFRHRFMEGLIDPECFHYFKKIGSK